MLDQDNNLVADAVKYITSTLKVDKERIKAHFTFIPREDDNPETIALAIEQILAKYFKIITPTTVLTQLRAGQSTSFTDDSVHSLPPRSINIILKPNHSVLAVEGVAAIDGEDGYSELFYSWKKAAGVIDEVGNIDLKRTNALSGVNRGDHLADIYLRQEGEPGITADGKKIKQQSGRPHKVKWNEHAILKSDIPEDETRYSLYAEKTGIVLATFLKKDDPRTLLSIDIQETVTIHGDVDYAVGDQGTIDGQGPECNFSLEIKGNVRGAFSLQSNGFIHVSGVIEGKSVVAEDIDANMITGRCVACAKNSIKVASIVNASAKARFISVEKNASGSKIQADELITFEKGANCVGLTLEAREINSTNNTFSGLNTIALGPSLFENQETLKKLAKGLQKEAATFSQPNRETALALLTDIARVESITKKSHSAGEKQILAIVDQLKKNFAVAIRAAGQNISDETTPLCYQLQEILAENKFHESVLVKVESLVGRIKKYNQTASELTPLVVSLQEKNEQLEEVNSQIKNGLIIHLKNPKMIGQSAAFRVFCGEAEKLFPAELFTGQEFEIRYHIPDGEEDVRKGKIVLQKL